VLDILTKMTIIKQQGDRCIGHLPPLTNNFHIGDMNVMAKTTLLNPQEEVNSKKCTKCGDVKLYSEFYRQKKTKDGYRTMCKECTKVASRYYYKNNREWALAYAKEYNHNHKEQTLRTKRQYEQRHHEKRIISRKKYYKDHKEYFSKWHKQYGQTVKGRFSSQKASQKRRAIKANAECEIFEPVEILERDNYICQYCGRKTRPDFKNPFHALYPNVDHIVPLSLGGPHTKQNTQCLCRQCNVKKRNTGKGDQLRMFG